MVRFELIPLDEKGRKRVNVELQGPHVSGFPLAFLTSFFETSTNVLHGACSPFRSSSS